MRPNHLFRTLLTGVLCLFAVGGFAATGDCESRAASISNGGSKDIKLVDEYDAEWGETTGAACYYLKATLKRGGEYTFWTSGTTPVSIDVYPKSEDCFVSAMSDTMYDGVNSRAYISSEDWYEDDEGGTFYIYVSGDNIGDPVTVHFSEGNVPDDTAVTGSSVAPVQITPKEKEGGKPQTTSGTTFGEVSPEPMAFYYRTGSVEAGRAYYFMLTPAKWSTAANATNDMVSLHVSSYYDMNSDDIGDGDFSQYDISTDEDLARGVVRLKVVPHDTTPLLIEVSSDDYSVGYTLAYWIAPSRLPAEHTDEGISIRDLGALTTARTADVASPKLRRWPLDSQYADPVIDQQLYSFSVTKGKSYTLGVEGLNLPTNLVVEVYDAKGKVLYSDRKGDPSQNLAALVAFEATADAVYYLGVAQDIADDEIEKLTAAEVIDFTCTVFAQEIARVVDTYETAEPLVFDIAGERTSMEHTFTLADWSDYFAFTPTRKDITYKMKVVPAEGALNADLPVVGTLYTLNTQGKPTPVGNYKSVDLRAGLSFNATTISQTSPVTYFLEVELDGAAGHAFGPYTVSTSMTSAKGGVGALQVTLLGGDGKGTWSLQGDESSSRKRPSGETAILPEGSYKLTFATVKDWSGPTNRTVEVAAGEVKRLTLNYNDTFDPKDDEPKTTTSKLTLKTGVNTFGRSLFGGVGVDGSDDVDWFSFTVSKDNTYRYDVWPSDDALEARLYTADRSFNMTEYVCERPTDNGFNFQPLPKGTYYIAVTRREGFEAFTGTYELYVVAYDLGSVKLDKASYTVKEDAGEVTFKISRTGTSEAAVYFSTKALSAVPGEDYVPVVSNLVEWAEGDKSAKTVTVPILPDMVSKWESNKTFRVYLHPCVDEWKEEMFGYTNTQPDILDPSSAVVTITETAKIAPGKIGFIGYERDGDETGIQSFENPKKATVTVAAGDAFKLWVGRGTATDGRVGVKLETKDGTAKSVNAKNPEAIDFTADWFTTTQSGKTTKLNTSTNLYWEAGIDEGRYVTIQTTENLTNFTERTFTVKLTVDTKAGQKATLDTTSTVTITIRNPNVRETAEKLIAALGKKPVVKVAATPKGAWFNATDGSFRSVPVTVKTKPSLTLTVTGPGVMKFKPALSKNADKVDFTCTYGKSKWIYASDGEVTLYLGKGNQTLKFALAPKKSVTLTDADDVYAVFANAYDGTFYSWTPLALATDPLPSDKQGLVSVTAKPNTTRLVWTGATGVHIGYAVTVADSQQNLTKNPVTTAVVTECAFDLQDWEPGKPCHWRVDTLWLEGDEVKLAATNSVWTFKTAQDAAATTVQMVGADGAGMGVPYNSGDTVRLIQGVKTTFTLGTSADIVEGTAKLTFKTAGGKLPTGLTLKNDTVTGVPTTEGTFTAVFQATAGKAAATTTALTFVVEPMGVAVGTFNGLVEAEDAGLSVRSQRLGSMAVTVSKQGKVTAKAKIGSATYSFNGTGFDRINVGVNGITNLQARLVATQRSGKATVTNACLVAVPMGAVDDAVALATPATCRMTLLAGDADECRYDSNPSCGLLRDSKKEALHLEGIAGYVGYYTVALPQPVADAAIGLGGAGYLTVTLDAKGGAKVAGMKGDGTTLSVSGVPGLAADGSLLIPLFASAKTAAIGGYLRLTKTAGGGIVADAMETFLWLEDDPVKTYAGEDGFAQELAPTGGLYDQLSNFQRYYLDRVLSFNTGSFGDDLALMQDEVYPAGFDWLALCPGRAEGKCFDAFGFTFLGDKVSIAKKSLEKREDDPKLYWFDMSENPANVSMKFTRATGVFSGAFSLWFADAWDQCDQTKQKEVTGAKYNGVFLTSRDDLSGGEVPSDYVALGSVTFPVNVKYTVVQGNREVEKTRKWTASWLFSIDAADISEDNADLWNSEAAE